MDLNGLFGRFKSISFIKDKINKISFIWIVFSLPCVLLVSILSTSSYAKDDSMALNTILSTNTDKDEMIVLFQQSTNSFDSMNQVGIHFLESVDCQTGWLGYYETPFEPAGLSINHATLFGLRADAVYRVGREHLDGTILIRTKSILTKLTGNTGHFANFLGRCSDQSINCCIPVRCSQKTGRCIVSTNLGVQFFNEYLPP